MVTEKDRVDILNALAAKKHAESSLSLAGQYMATKIAAKAAVDTQTAKAQKLRNQGADIRRRAEGLKKAFKK